MAISKLIGDQNRSILTIINHTACVKNSCRESILPKKRSTEVYACFMNRYDQTKELCKEIMKSYINQLKIIHKVYIILYGRERSFDVSQTLKLYAHEHAIMINN